MANRGMTPTLRKRVFKRDNYTCRYCGSKDGPFHADHVYPFSRSGVTSIDNLVTACEHCNISKHNKIGIWPKPIGYFDERRKMESEITERAYLENQELKLSGVTVFLILLGSGVMAALTLVLPVEVVSTTERIAVYSLFVFGVFLTVGWIVNSLRN